MRTLVIGDIHGAYKALLQCFERSNFDKENDTLITLGDVTDGWSETPECVDELLTVKNRIDIRGNHDYWLLDWLETGSAPTIWLSQGGKEAMHAYIRTGKSTEESHKRFFREQRHYYVDDQNRLFVHGGFYFKSPIEWVSPGDLMWDRYTYEIACMWEVDNRKGYNDPPYLFKAYKEIFIGHTSTTYLMNKGIGKTDKPLRVANLWNLDQGAGWDGKLSIMDVDTKEFWQSDLCFELYPDEKGRR